MFCSLIHTLVVPFLGSLRKQGLGVPIVQQHQEFSIQNEDFPALPGYKGAGLLSSSLEVHTFIFCLTYYSVLHQKDYKTFPDIFVSECYKLNLLDHSQA